MPTLLSTLEDVTEVCWCHSLREISIFPSSGIESRVRFPPPPPVSEKPTRQSCRLHQSPAPQLRAVQQKHASFHRHVRAPPAGGVSVPRRDAGPRRRALHAVHMVSHRRHSRWIFGRRKVVQGFSPWPGLTISESVSLSDKNPKLPCAAIAARTAGQKSAVRRYPSGAFGSWRSARDVIEKKIAEP